MRQRVAIAIALLHRPELIIADEPTTALDVTVQGQILAQMQALVRETGSALMWITHDLAVVAGLAQRVAVMYAGRIVEQGPVGAVLDAPWHPYTRGLLDSVPANNVRGVPLRQIAGMTPAPGQLPAGCAFRPRCPQADARCIEEPPLVAGPARVRRARARPRHRCSSSAMSPSASASGSTQSKGSPAVSVRAWRNSPCTRSSA
jgi:peptide/nickel transport system ATP-binding protein